MTARLRLVFALSRPPVVMTLGLFAALGLAQAGVVDDEGLAVRLLAMLAGLVLFSAVLNDLADEAVDRVNLAGRRDRPLVAGTASRGELPSIAAAGAAVAVAAGATLGWRTLAVLIAGLVVSATYSLPPLRLAAKGAVASLVLPALFVAVPFAGAVLAVKPSLDGRDAVLLAGLYAGFVGRILLKDFRDVRGDAMLGKRTFVVRYGRRPTCATAAAAWVVGSSCLLGVRGVTGALVVAQAAYVLAALVLLRRLARDDLGRRTEERLISAVAIVGRGMVLTVAAHLGMTVQAWHPGWMWATTLGITVLMLGQAAGMVRHGPAPRLRLPAGWATQDDRQTRPAAGSGQ